MNLTERTQLLSPERIAKFDNHLNTYGLCSGKGSPNGEMCIEALITQILDEPFSDEPECVTAEIRNFKISLNDTNWSSNQARAVGLRNIGIAQIGSKGVVDGPEFLKGLQTKIIGVLIPVIFRKIFKNKKEILLLVDICEKQPTRENCLILKNAASADAAYAYYASSAAAAAAYADVAYASDAASAYAAAAYTSDAASADYYLIMCANLALEVLKEMNSPGCAWLG